MPRTVKTKLVDLRKFAGMPTIKTNHLPFVPEGFQVFYNDTYYKMGRFGFPFMWDGVEWVKTTKSMDEIREAISKADINKKYETNVIAKRIQS